MHKSKGRRPPRSALHREQLPLEHTKRYLRRNGLSRRMAILRRLGLLKGNQT